MNVRRPLLQWHGGKWLLAEWILGFIPDHKVYVEPYGGAASVLLQKDRSHTEVYNDLHDDVVNLFAVLRRPKTAAALIKLVRLTPFSRQEFNLAYEPTDDPVERAHRLLVRSYLGHGTSGATSGKRAGFRSNTADSWMSPAKAWAAYPEELSKIIERLRGVVIESMDALDLMRKHDGANTLFYVDPPYLPETRTRHHGYLHEMSAHQHRQLLEFLHSLQGMVVLSGYHSVLYDSMLADWRRHELASHAADGSSNQRQRVEVVWLNPACVRAQMAPDLFSLT